MSLKETNPKFEVKDSGERLNFESGMQRDIESDKPRFDLLIALDDNYEQCLLTRWANLLSKGAIKYSERNWEKASSIEEFKRFKSSAFRHFIQAITGEDDEDHFAAVLFNLNGMIYLMNKLKIDAKGNPVEPYTQKGLESTNEPIKEDKAKISYDQFLNSVDKSTAIFRHGQSIMKVLYNCWPEESYRITRTSLDCFYLNDRAKFTLEHLKQVWRN